MKIPTLVAMVAGVCLSASAQGLLNFGNNLGASLFRAPIFYSEPDFYFPVSGQGSGSLFFPTGAVNYGGANLLSGTGFTLALYAGASSISDPNQLSLVYTTTFRTGAAAGFINTTSLAIPGVQPGKTAKFQVRVWDNQGGTITSWYDFARFSVANNVSQVVSTGPLGGTDSDGTVFPINPDATGWTSFTIYVLPEPSVTRLLIVGGVGGALFFQRSKKESPRRN